jgi:hypothetical protein
MLIRKLLLSDAFFHHSAANGDSFRDVILIFKWKFVLNIYESPRAKTRHLGTKFFFDLDTPLKCGESSLSIPLCGKIR